MDNEQFIILLNNKLNALNAALASAIQSGNVESVATLNAEISEVERTIQQLRVE